MNQSKKKIPGPATGIRRIWNAFFYSLEGLKHGIKNEAAVRQETILSCILIPAALLLPVSPTLKLILILCNISVIITELLNSAVECVVDKVCQDYDPLAKQAKDMGSAAVMLSICCLCLSWVFALFQLF
jgi:diacylglycerol kinase (ATP)